MADKFQTHVNVRNPETGDSQWFKPGDSVPDWAEGQFDPKHLEEREDVDPTLPPPIPPRAGETDYRKMKKAELEALAADRNLDFEGTKDDLVERLEESDAALG